MPMVRQNGVLADGRLGVGARAAAALLKGKRAFVLASPNLSNEALFLLGKLVAKTNGAGAFRVEQGDEAPLPGVPDLALRAERAANVRGAELLGFTRSDSPLGAMKQGDVLIVADEELAALDAPDVAKAGAVIVIGTTLPAWARHGAPSCCRSRTSSEEEGTFTNLRGRVQRFLQAKAAPGLARPSFFVIGDLLAAMGEGRAATGRQRRVRRARRIAAGVRRHVLRRARAQGRDRRRRDGGEGERMTLPPCCCCAQFTRISARRPPPDVRFVWFIASSCKMIVVFTVYMVGVAMLTLAERKISAWIQDRHGPNRVGKGWLQPAADGLKNIMKEETYPAAANLPLFILAPVLSFIPAR